MANYEENPSTAVTVALVAGVGAVIYFLMQRGLKKEVAASVAAAPSTAATVDPTIIERIVQAPSGPTAEQRQISDVLGMSESIWADMSPQGLHRQEQAIQNYTQRMAMMNA